MNDRGEKTWQIIFLKKKRERDNWKWQSSGNKLEDATTDKKIFITKHFHIVGSWNRLCKPLGLEAGLYSNITLLSSIGV